MKVSLGYKLAAISIFVAAVALVSNVYWYALYTDATSQRKELSSHNASLVKALSIRQTMIEAIVLFHDYIFTEDFRLKTRRQKKFAEVQMALASEEVDFPGEAAHLSKIQRELEKLSKSYDLEQIGFLQAGEESDRMEAGLFKEIDELIAKRRLVAAEYDKRLSSTEERVMFGIFMWALASLLGTPAFIILVYINILMPIRDLSLDARMIKGGNLDHRITVPHTGDEIDELAVQLNEMTCSIKDFYQEREKRLTQLSKVCHTTVDVGAGFSLSKLLDTILTTGLEIAGASSGSIMLVTSNRQELVTKIEKNMGGLVNKKTRIRMGEGIAGTVAATGRSLILHGGAAYDPRLDEVGNDSGAITVPLMCKGAVIGVLNVSGKKRGEKFDQEDQSLLSILAEYVAAAIERSRLFAEIRKTYFRTVKALVATVEAKDLYTYGHSSRVAKYATGIARRMNLAREEVEGIEVAAYLHDIGKIGISETIIAKSSDLTAKERSLIREYPQTSLKIISNIDFPWKNVSSGIFTHHERLDGRGYPKGLKDESIPLEGRIIAVADAFDAMTSTRAYRKALTQDKAMAEITKNQGVQFDRRVVAALISYLKKNAPAVETPEKSLLQ
ncbi:MAG: HD domain-containing protein [Actinomycetota bacterium]|nr:HD domain-containing protein [Actinomycetota bacterium]